MPATASVSPSEIPYVDYVDSGTKWAVSNLTYSFPASGSFYVGLNGAPYGSGEQNSGFKAFTPIQQVATASILNLYSAVANVTFTQIAETSTQSGVLRYAESNMPSTSWAYLPSPLPEGGDAWFNNSTGWYDQPAVGNYAWLTIIHETGHLLGLKHPQEAIGLFGAVPASVDSLEYTVMSYRSYIGASTTQGLTNGTWSFPTTPMLFDIAALQYMYGANYSTNSGDTVYRWNPTTGQETINGVAQAAPGGNKIFMAVWDGGGIDSYDFSNYTTSLSVNLQPGNWTTISSTQLANLGGGHIAIGNIANGYLYNNNPASLIENAIGGSGNDTIVGNATNNRFTGGAGNDTLDGVSGTSDVAVYLGSSTSYQVTQNSDGSWTVADLRSGNPDGADTLRNIEFLQFSDRMVAVGPIQPVTIIESNGSTSLTEVGNHFYLYNNAGSGPSLKYSGSDFVAGQFGAWAPISAEQTASGYEVAWRLPGADQYTIWTTDSNGNYISNASILSGTSATVESAETRFHQDLNGDGVIGPPPLPTTVIESNGSTSLTEVGGHFYLYNNAGSGPSLKYSGSDFMAGQFGAWAPIGAEQTGSGYEVAWRLPGADQYTIWTTDSNGNYISNASILSGTSATVESAETRFHQDLNSDGVIGPSAGPVPVNIASDPILNNSLIENMSAQVQIGDDTFVFSDSVKKADIANFQESNDLVPLANALLANLDDMPALSVDAESHLTVTIDASHPVLLTELNSHFFHI